MGTYNPRRLCRPEILRAVDSRYLEQLLAPHAAYLARHGVTLPLVGREAPLQYLALAKLFTAPDGDMPAELIDALYFIDDLATPAGMEALEKAARESGMPMLSPYELTAAEVALQVWLRNRQLAERVHAEMAVSRFRVFNFFQSQASKPPKLPESLDAGIKALEAELNECFQARRRGPYARILVDQRDDVVWTYIAHGGLLKREATIEKTGPSSICYRPEVYDAVAYYPDTGELAIHASSEWERELYQRLLGKHFFRDERLFAGAAKYTLEPLRRYHEQALTCIDVPGIQWVRLVQLTTYEKGRYPRADSSRSDDLFRSWEQHGPFRFPSGRLVSAGFRIKLLGCATARRVTIRPSNRAQYSRDLDRDCIEEWLKQRGFILGNGGASHAATEKVLAIA